MRILTTISVLLISLMTLGSVNDSIVSSYGLSSEYFELILVKDAPKDVFKGLSSHAIKPTDTVLIAKVDTFQNKLNIIGKTLNHKLVLSGKVFKKGISFHKTRFKEKVYLNECHFLDRVDFSHAVFDTTLILWRTMYKKAGVFSNATFNDIQFLDTQFDEDVQFHNSIFKGDTYFLNTKFKKGTYFNDAVFYDLTNFNFSEFETMPLFWQSTSYDTITFYSAKLSKGIDFQSSKFGLLLGLDYLESKGRIYFDDVLMPKQIDLKSIKTDNVIDFNYINDSIKTNKYAINIYSTDLNKLMLTDQFTLCFDEYLSLDIKNSIYKSLLDDINQKGYKKLFKTFDIEYKQFINDNYNHLGEKLAYFINKFWWNFGYNRSRVFIWTLIFIFLFSIPIRIYFNLFVDKVYKYEKISLKFKTNQNIKNPILRFIANYWLAFIYTIFVFFNLKLDFEKLSFNNYLASFWILLLYAIGLICSAFIVNLVITI